MATTTEMQTKAAQAPSLDTENELIAHVETLHTKPLWAAMARYNPPLPNPKCTPHVWRYDEIRPSLIRAGELVDEKRAERRVLMMVNPSRDAPYTTDTLYAGLQCVMPNETAPAHRHVAFALRFVIEGQGGFTAVHGRRVNMQHGDVILTPRWNWHDHGLKGSEPMIWLDGLDLPNFVHFPVHFVEHYDKPRYPAEDVDSDNSPIVFPWWRMKESLDGKGGDWVRNNYLKEDGREVSLVVGASAERLNAGKSSPPVQETASSVFHVKAGSGHSVLNGKTFKWKQGDTFCVPSWYKYQHFADSGENVYLFRFHDTPMLKALGFYRFSGQDDQSLMSD